MPSTRRRIGDQIAAGKRVIARAARQMRVRDDEDLAVNQLAAAGREDDPGLASHRTGRGAVLQEAAAERAEPAASSSGRERLIELRERIGRFQVALSALPTRPLARFDELEAKSRLLSASRAEHEQGLAALRQPARRFGRLHDPDAAQRAFLQTAIEIDGRALAELVADRARLQRELGDPDQVRSERDGIENAIAELQRERDQVLDALAQSAVDRPPHWLTEALGHRPHGARERDIWDHAARTVARFRLDHDIDDQHKPFGPQPIDDTELRREWQQASAALERAQRQLGRGLRSRDRGIELGLD